MITDSMVAEFCDTQAYGMPQTVPVDWDALAKRMAERNTPIAVLADALGPDGSKFSEAIEKREDFLDTALFIQTARALEAPDFNQLVRQPSMKSTMAASEEPALRALLDAADDVRFIMSRALTVADHSRMVKAAEELIASRKLRTMNRSDVISLPLEDFMFSVDAGEFLHVADEIGVLTLAAFVPMFLHLPNQELPGASVAD